MANSVSLKGFLYEWKIENPLSVISPESEEFIFHEHRWKLQLRQIDMFLKIFLVKTSSEKLTTGYKIQCSIQDSDKNSVNVIELDLHDHASQEVWWIYRDYFKKPTNKYLTNGNMIFFIVFSPTDEIKKKIQQKVSGPKSEDPTLACFEDLTQDLNRMLDEGALSDVNLTCGVSIIPAHRNILSARSEVFAAMLRADMEENRTGNIEITDMEVHVFKQLVHFIYTSKLSDLSTDTAPELYMAGEKYAIESLKSRCSVFIKENLTEENSCNILVLADVHNDKDLKDCAIAFIMKNELPLHDDIWVPFCELYPKLGIEVLRLAYKEKCELK